MHCTHCKQAELMTNLAPTLNHDRCDWGMKRPVRTVTVSRLPQRRGPSCWCWPLMRSSPLLSHSSTTPGSGAPPCIASSASFLQCSQGGQQGVSVIRWEGGAHGHWLAASAAVVHACLLAAARARAAMHGGPTAFVRGNKWSPFACCSQLPSQCNVMLQWQTCREGCTTMHSAASGTCSVPPQKHAMTSGHTAPLTSSAGSRIWHARWCLGPRHGQPHCPHRWCQQPQASLQLGWAAQGRGVKQRDLDLKHSAFKWRRVRH